MHEAKTKLSKLLALVEAGEDVVITRGGQPVARLVAIPRQGERPLGAWAGQIRVADDFDQTPEWLIEEFEK